MEVSKGDRVVLTNEFIQKGSYLAQYTDAVGVVEEVLTEWDKDDLICWDVHVNFRGNVNGVHWGDVRKI